MEEYKMKDIIFPEDAGIVDVTKAPYFARGDGRSDDTAANEGVPAFINNESSISITIGENAGRGGTYDELVCDTRDGITGTIYKESFPKRSGSVLVLYTGYRR